MTKRTRILALVTLGLVAALAVGTRTQAEGEKKAAVLSHDVYFKLNDGAKPDDLVAACKKYLSGHDGTVFYAAGTLAQDLKREVNDTDFDVALHIVFKDKAAHDKYQDHPKHKQFIDENKANWKKVRVFDSYVTQ